MKLGNLIIRPILTERSVALTGLNMYEFEVTNEATKDGIAQEAKRLFNVDVLSVNTILLPGKKRRIIGTRRYSKGTKMKKAIVKVKAGQKIDLFTTKE
jgi:large subunit ribosomal protein L23